jgi:hypothetical protein
MQRHKAASVTRQHESNVNEIISTRALASSLARRRSSKDGEGCPPPLPMNGFRAVGDCLIGPGKFIVDDLP